MIIGMLFVGLTPVIALRYIDVEPQDAKPIKEE